MNCDACKHKNVIKEAGMAIAKEEKSMKKHSVSLHYGAGYGMMKCAEKAEQITQAQSSYVMPEMAGGGGAQNGD